MRTLFPEPKYFICHRTIQAAKKMVAYYNRVLAPFGITAQQMMALGVLWRREGISLGEFSQRAGMGKAAAVTMIKRLEMMGYVQREPDPVDARRNILRLTPRAHELAPEVAKKVTALEKSIESSIGKSNMTTLIRGITAIRDLDL
jgi:DNA-binding MarR family transcriptional regulator